MSNIGSVEIIFYIALYALVDAIITGNLQEHPYRTIAGIIVGCSFYFVVKAIVKACKPRRD